MQFSPLKSLFFLGLSLSSFVPLFGAGHFMIVSDFDDTIKITGAHKTWVSFTNTLIGKPPIAGMREVSRDWVASAGVMWNVVSGTPSFLRGSVENFFEKFQLPLGDLTLRKLGKDSSTQAYKERVIGEIIKKSQERVILVGDDTQADAAAYVNLKGIYGSKILSIYIHQVNPKRPELPKGVQPYISPAELVLREMHEKHLSDLTLGRVLVEMSQNPMKELFPSYYYCPTDFEIDRQLLKPLHATMVDAVLRHELAVEAYCQKRARSEVSRKTVNDPELLYWD